MKKHTIEKDLSVMWMVGNSNCKVYYIENTMGAEGTEEADGNASIFQEAINISNRTGLSPRQLLDENLKLHQQIKDLTAKDF